MVQSCRKVVALVTVLLLAPVFVSAATLSISPQSGSYEVGDRFTVRVVMSASEAINAVSGELKFPTSVFAIDSVSKFSSILNFWVSEPSYSNTLGKVNFEGVVLGGFQGGTGTVVTLNLRAVSVGSGRIDFVSGQVLANDGQGTNVTQGTTGANFSIVEATKPKPVEKKVEVVEEVAKPDLAAPEIELVSKYGERAVSGISSYPKSEVVLTFVNEVGVKIFILGSTDDSGKFLLLVPKSLKRGEYSVSAQVVQKGSSYSAVSNTIKIKIGNIISDIGWGARIAFILLILALIYVSYRLRMYFVKNSKMKYEAGEVKDVVKKSFKILEEDIENSKDNAKNAKDREGLSNTLKDLSEAESVILKEIKDIEKL
ncbi:MAG TPA: cohesin domain-containing protein [Parcubacteria group bacterium]|nr:cohesin domain-containing protein [Parcubacteria group bacterium]